MLPVPDAPHYLHGWTTKVKEVWAPGQGSDKSRSPERPEFLPFGGMPIGGFEHQSHLMNAEVMRMDNK